MNFFCTKEHQKEWQDKLSGNTKEIYGLNLADALAVAKRIFG